MNQSVVARTLTPKNIESRSIIVHRMTLGELLQPGKVQTSHPRVRLHPKIEKFDAEAPQPTAYGAVAVKLVEFGRPVEPLEALEALKAAGMKPGTFRHHLAFALLYADREPAVVASLIRSDLSPAHRVAKLSDRYVDLVPTQFKFGKNTKFLALA